MAIFRKPRRQRHSGSSEGSGGSSRGPGLGELLRGIAAAASAPEDALEPALRAILEASGARAGALCLFDPRQSILRLAAEAGLSDEGCRRLRNVRRADPTTWDMPLHGLLNRRAYLIESASRNRYVPPLVENPAAVRTVACIPLYGGPTPLGSLILVALAPRSFAERDIRTLERPLRELSRMIETVRRRGTGMESSASQAASARAGADLIAIIAERDRLREELAEQLTQRANLMAELTTRGEERDRLRVALDQASSERARLSVEVERARKDTERIELLSASLAAAERERARLATTLETAAAERAEQARAQSALERARAEAERAAQIAAAELESAKRTAAETTASVVKRAAERAEEIERLRARLGEAETSLGRERELVRERERDHERLVSELRVASAREQQLRDELGSTAARAGSESQADVREALARATAAEEARAAARAEAEAARTALASAEAVVEALEEEANRAHGQIERLETAERVEHAEQNRLEGGIQEALTRATQADARLGEIEREVGTLRQERKLLEAAGREREAEFAALGAHIEALSAERDRLREAAAALEADRDRLVTEAAAASASHSRLEQSLARETAERTRLASALATLEATHAKRDAEAAERAVEKGRLGAERDRGTAARDSAETASEPRSGEAAAPEASAEAEPRKRETVRVVTVAPAATRGRVRDMDAGRRVVAVIDVDPGWERVAVEGHHLEVCAPGAEVAERLAELKPSRIVVNLLAPTVLETLSVLRAGGSTACFWGCLASPESDRALALGMIEPATRPIDCDAILTALGAHAARGTRVVTAGADVDALMSLRQAMSRRGMSVSMAWDAKQATELLGVVRPEVVVVDLELPRRDGFSVVAKLGSVDPLPTSVLVAAPGDMAAGFAAALADPTHVGQAVPLERLLADIVARSETPAERRPQKIRALGRK